MKQISLVAQTQDELEQAMLSLNNAQNDVELERWRSEVTDLKAKCEEMIVILTVRKKGEKIAENSSTKKYLIFSGSVVAKRLKALNLFGNCQRPVFSLNVSQHMHKITNR